MKLVANGKPDQGIIARWFRVCGDGRNVARHFPLDRCQKRVDLTVFTFDHKLDAAVWKVADIARDFQTSSQRLACGAKPHALNPARKHDPPANPRHEPSPRAGGDAATVLTNKGRWQTIATFSSIMVAAQTGPKQVVLNGICLEMSQSQEKVGADRPKGDEQRRSLCPRLSTSRHVYAGKVKAIRDWPLRLRPVSKAVGLDFLDK